MSGFLMAGTRKRRGNSVSESIVQSVILYIYN
jgi:hypothetical protein